MKPLTILVVDDDDLSRDLLRLLLTREGYSVETAASGDEAVASLEQDSIPDVILTDMQMPGLSSSPLAQRLRELACNARLLAMSGSPCSEDATRGFDGFLLKPFSMEALGSAISSAGRPESQSAGDPPAFSSAVVLDETVYRKLSAAMSATKLTQLYSLCLDDVAGRVTKMRAAAESGDDETYRREAHAIKGGCGLVGAVELQTIATSEENTGIHANHVATLDEFLNASERLQRMLIAHQHHLNDSTVVTETRSNA